MCGIPHRERTFLVYLSLLVQAPSTNEWWMAGNTISGLVERWPALTALTPHGNEPFLDHSGDDSALSPYH